MPKSDNQKLKILYILDYLEKNSHQEHPVRANEIIEWLNREHNILCDRKTVYSDISALIDYGADIVSIPGKNGGYYIATRNFEMPELRLLIHAVQSSRYLTEKKSQELIRKLCTLCSSFDANRIRHEVLIAGRVKNMNETIYYTVDTIQEAIAQNRKIRFRYFDWGLDKKRIYRKNEYVASPYGLCQDHEFCYLLAHSERHGPTNYRVDRMCSLVLLPEARTPCPELTGNRLNEYAERMFAMFSGDTATVKMRFHRELINVVIDKFGKSVMLFPDGAEHFVFTVEVAVSPQFLSWVIGFGSKAKILYPESVADACRKLCQEVLDIYTAEKD